VLEGLNACLDHRGEVFIPELGKTFHIQSDSTRLFGAQNPLRQGGARRGLPQSFLNRFTQVHLGVCMVVTDFWSVSAAVIHEENVFICEGYCFLWLGG
jgi:midasin